MTLLSVLVSSFCFFSLLMLQDAVFKSFGKYHRMWQYHAVQAILGFKLIAVFSLFFLPDPWVKSIFPFLYLLCFEDSIKDIVAQFMRFLRFRAIICALYYGILPWWLYEEEKHYKSSYFIHLISNIGYACKWLFFLESEEDQNFELQVNDTQELLESQSDWEFEKTVNDNA